jgi:prefoldin beta subunit
MCLQEFNNLPEDAKIYKSHGPLLLEQSLSEAQDLVSKRLEYISGEIGRVESVLTELRGKQDDVRGEILKLSNQPVRREVSS